jgi:hypothetical protein
MSWRENWTWRKPRKLVYVVSKPRLNDAELALAFLVTDDNPLWRGVNQLIDDLVRESTVAARQHVSDHGLCASDVGGSELLELLRTMMNEKRDRAQAARADLP